jgi:hypothetical protein
VGDAIGQMLSSAIGVAISPLPLIVIVLLLATPRGRIEAIAFTAGWILALAAVGIVLMVIGAGADHGGQPATWTYWLKLALGALFAAMALRQWRTRPRGQSSATTPGWMSALDRCTPARAAGLGVLLSAANPKNLALTVGAAAGIAGATSSTGARATALALFVMIASLNVLVPLAVYLAGGQKAAGILNAWKTAMARHNSAIMVTVLTVLAAKYIGDAISGLT